MADRIPLIVNAAAGQIQELGAVDPIVGVSTFTMSGVLTLSKSSGTSLVVSSNQASSSKTTGAVTVVGGVGVSGNLNVGGDITAFATSDENWKDNLSPITNALTRVGLMTGYTFTWNDKAGTPQWTHLVGKDDTGLIAQDVEKLGLPGIFFLLI